ncbi:hypothetical protein HanPI659440_Chr10g0362421 [Helianthus annuus]|nr:hypothetical protein HanPI659440_Chr10g0362421 [Helianthus annuus]
MTEAAKPGKDYGFMFSHEEPNDHQVILQLGCYNRSLCIQYKFCFVLLFDF